MMLTQEQIDELQNEFTQDRAYKERSCMSTTTEDEVLEALDMAEMILAIEWAIDTDFYCKTCNDNYAKDRPDHHVMCMGLAMNCAYNNMTAEQTLGFYKERDAV